MKVKVTLSIGFPTATQTGVIDIPEDSFKFATSQAERESIIQSHVEEWMWNYVTLEHEVVE